MEIGIIVAFINHNWNNNCSKNKKYIIERKMYVDNFYYNFQLLSYSGIFDFEKNKMKASFFYKKEKLLLVFQIIQGVSSFVKQQIQNT